jgi:hypothetical protein
MALGHAVDLRAAEQAVGRVSAADGAFFAGRSNPTIESGDVIRVGDSLLVGRAGSLEVRFMDGHRLVLSGGSFVRIQPRHASIADPKSPYLVRVVQGSFRWSGDPERLTAPDEQVAGAGDDSRPREPRGRASGSGVSYPANEQGGSSPGNGGFSGGQLDPYDNGSPNSWGNGMRSGCNGGDGDCSLAAGGPDLGPVFREVEAENLRSHIDPSTKLDPSVAGGPDTSSTIIGSLPDGTGLTGRNPALELNSVTSKDLARDGLGQQDLAKEAVQSVGQEIARDAVQSVGREIARDAVQAVGQEIARDTVQAVGQAITRDTLQSVGQAITRDTVQSAGQAIARDTVRSVSEDLVTRSIVRDLQAQ